MKRSLLTALCVCVSILSYAQTTVNVGYSGKQLANESTVYSDGEHWVDAAIYLPAERLKAYTNAEISALRVALANRIGVKKLKAWVRTDLTGENLAEGEITTETEPAIKKGWNVINLNKAIKVSGAEGLYIGMSYYQNKKTAVLSLVDEGRTNGFFLKTNPDGAWEDLGHRGILSIEAVVSGNALPKTDLSIISSTVKITPDGMMGRVVLNNEGQENVTGIVLTANAVKLNFQCEKSFDKTIKVGDTLKVDFPIDFKVADLWKESPIDITITSLGSAKDENEVNDSKRAVYLFPKKVLIEEFTTANCGFCPGVTKLIDDVLKIDKYAEKTFVIARHAGYGTDQFSNAADTQYLWLYNNNGRTSTPKIMTNREPFGVNAGGLTPVWQPTKASDIKAVVDNLSAANTYAIITRIEGRYDQKTGQLKVSLSGLRSKEFATMPTRISVVLTEDKLYGEQSDYNNVYADEEYYHNFVARRYNSVWGDVIDWKDNAFDYETTFTLNNKWVKENLKVIAYINAYDEKDPGNCAIENVEGITFPQITGVEGVSTDDAEVVAVDYYTLDGMKIAAKDAVKGVFIIKTRKADGKISACKVIK